MNDLGEQCISGAPSSSKSTFHAKDSTADETYQMESPWDTIIVNQIPTDADDGKLTSLFSQYGNIENTYLSKRPTWGGPGQERIARIKFSNKTDAWKVWEAFQKKIIKYNNHVLMITLASDDYSPIQNLPDTCLREIFKRVDSVEDKFNVELVCKRWEGNGRCCWSNISEITLTSYWGIKTWRVIFSRIADSLKDLEILLDTAGEEALVEAVAAQPCIHLKFLRCIFPSDINYARCAPQIETIVRQSRNLQYMEFAMWTPHCNVNINFIKHLPVQLGEMKVYINEEDSIPLTVALSRFQNLISLSLHGLIINDHHFIDNVVNLKRLSLAECDIPQSIVSQILRNNKRLQYLNIALDHLGDASLMCLQRLPKLQVLVIKSHEFTDAYLGAMSGVSTLRALCCHECLITDEGLQNFFKPGSIIEELEIDDCATTSQSVIIIREWMERTGQSLKLVMNGQEFDRNSVSEWQDTRKLEAIDYEDYYSCEAWKEDWGVEFVDI